MNFEILITLLKNPKKIILEYCIIFSDINYNFPEETILLWGAYIININFRNFMYIYEKKYSYIHW
jgi:hypothetical protein